MERGAKHGPMRDDELAHEAEGLTRGARASRAEPWREPEPTDGYTGPVPRQNDHAPFGISDLAAALDQAEFPQAPPDLIHVAEKHGAAYPILEALRHLPEDQEYADLGDLADAVGVTPE